MSDPRGVDCREALDLLYDYLDGELTPERARDVREHLEHCQQCFHLSRFEDAFIRFLEARARSRRAPPSLKMEVLRRLLVEGESAESG